MGSDHELFAFHKPARLCGVDLTQRAIDFTSRRLALRGLSSELNQADAENLPFPDATFDIVYSWGVLHHTPGTQQGFNEAARALKPGVYHTRSITGLMLWLRYSLVPRKFHTMADVYSTYLESPGTKAYSVAEARQMMARAGFHNIDVGVRLSPGDLLEGEVGQRHRGPLLRIAKAVWPRRLFRLLAPSLGLHLLIEARRDR
jgi:ubiquinone/menaquinone biosynthesis C-methylase UbiE